MNQIVINIVLLCLIGMLFTAIIYNRQQQLSDDIMWGRDGMLVKICADTSHSYEDFKSCIKRVDKGLE